MQLFNSIKFCLFSLTTFHEADSWETSTVHLTATAFIVMIIQSIFMFLFIFVFIFVSFSILTYEENYEENCDKTSIS